MASWPPPTRPRAQISRVPYLPGLDGLRALAVAAVVVYHANHTWLGGGFLGVEVFFVISGYLITLLLISEHERTGRVSLRKFWARRARRLLPALFTMLAALGVYLAIFNRRPQGQARGDFLGGLFYGSNWYQIWVGQGYASNTAFAPLRHLWSLAVEEQFYLLWPLVMVLVLRRGRDHLPRVALWLAGVSVAVSLAVGLVYVDGDIAAQCTPERMNGYLRVAGRCVNINEALYLGTFSRAGGLLLGAAFAMVWRPLAIARGPLRTKPHRLDLLALLGLAALAVLMWKLTLVGDGVELGSRYDPWLFRGGFLLVALATLTVIAAVTHRRSWIGRFLGNPVLNWLGTRSYGLYLFHWPIYQIIRDEAGVGLKPSEFILAMAVALPVTELSYRFIESPVRQGKLGDWLRGERHRQPAAVYRRRQRMVMVSAMCASLVGFAGVSISVAQNKCVSAVECLTSDGDAANGTLPAVLPTLPPATTTASSTASSTISPDRATSTSTTPITDPGTGAGGTTTTTTVAPATTTTTLDPASLLTPIAVGESVMLGAKTNLQAGGFYVDAVVSRQGPDMARLIENFRPALAPGTPIVIQIGTNGSVSDDTLNRIMAQLPADVFPTVRFLTVRAPKGWIADNNVRIRRLPERFSNVQIIDWETASHSVTICDDGIHVACGSGVAQYYANLIFDGIGRPELKR